MLILKSILLIVVSLFAVSCTHLNKKINRLPYHSSKSNTLDKLGRPFKIERKQGLDYWIYKFKINNREYTKAIIFKDGFSLKKSKRSPYPDPRRLIEEAENFKEYKEAVKHYKKYRLKK